ncbi:hypothetical protein D5F01_LYC24774 [Larimichthys crocea]|uniref:Uncharacterized protein n=1 Tax=Larimichthys crocea TaxID=215358 RepID=A0A6G0HE27_LARCR|nr:hypothetical protein D5F01_LYC24774 [Larimichthys crocea]
MEQWIPRILDVETKADRIKLERAHCIPGPTASKLPRAMIVRFHNFSDRQRVMEAAWCKKEVLFEGVKIYFFQDFATETLKRKREFVAVKRELQNIPGARYAMLWVWLGGVVFCSQDSAQLQTIMSSPTTQELPVLLFCARLYRSLLELCQACHLSHTPPAAFHRLPTSQPSLFAIYLLHNKYPPSASESILGPQYPHQTTQQEYHLWNSFYPIPDNG